MHVAGYIQLYIREGNRGRLRSANDEQCSERCLVRAGIWLLIELYRVLGACLILFEEGLSCLREQLIMCLPRPPPAPQSCYSTQASSFSPEAVVYTLGNTGMREVLDAWWPRRRYAGLSKVSWQLLD